MPLSKYIPSIRMAETVVIFSGRGICRSPGKRFPPHLQLAHMKVNRIVNVKGALVVQILLRLICAPRGPRNKLLARKIRVGHFSCEVIVMKMFLSTKTKTWLTGVPLAADVDKPILIGMVPYSGEDCDAAHAQGFQPATVCRWI